MDETALRPGEKQAQLQLDERERLRDQLISTLQDCSLQDLEILYVHEKRLDGLEQRRNLLWFGQGLACGFVGAFAAAFVLCAIL